MFCLSRYLLLQAQLLTCNMQLNTCSLLTLLSVFMDETKVQMDYNILLLIMIFYIIKIYLKKTPTHSLL